MTETQQNHKLVHPFKSMVFLLSSPQLIFKLYLILVRSELKSVEHRFYLSLCFPLNVCCVLSTIGHTECLLMFSELWKNCTAL